ncbi:MAG: outer membrane beta-barrel family protein, partial [Prevotella sp.]|nr:outer membrane beta-barrel family protein [Prevotella sp.]
NVNTDAVLNSQKLYFFAQLQGSLWKFNYMLGVGASYNRVYQEDIGFAKWTFRPQLSLKYSPSKNTSIRLSSRLSEITPSLSALSDVRQQEDDLTANDGNPYLKPWWQNSNSLSFDWDTQVFSLNYYGSLSYSFHPISSSIYPELQDDGSYMIITKSENQKNFLKSYQELDFTLHAIKDVLDLKAYGSFSTFRSHGINYLHTYNYWQWGCSAELMLGNWDVSYEFGTADRSLWGENIYGGENGSSLAASYKYKGLEVGLGVMLLGYAQGFDYYSECLSQYYKSVGHTYIKNNGNMIYFSVAYKFSYGRKYNTGSRKLYNSDNDNGVK